MLARKQARMEQAHKLVQNFWGATGNISAGSTLRDKLVELKLSSAQFEDLRDDIPVDQGGGTTAQRTVTADRILERLARR